VQKAEVHVLGAGHFALDTAADEIAMLIVMTIHDLGAQAIQRMVRVDLAKMKEEPPSLIGTFEFHGCKCAGFSGRPPWELHKRDQILHILDGKTDLTLLEGGTSEDPSFARGRPRYHSARLLAQQQRSKWRNDALDNAE
jgi:hypothetical protein